MDIRLNTKQLPPPVNIQISYPKKQGQAFITWNPVKDPDGAGTEIPAVMYNIYRGISANGIFYKQNSAPLQTNSYEEKNLGKNPNTTYWYKVSAVYYKNNDPNSVVEGPLSSPIVYQVNNTNKWFNKMNERNLWILKNTGQLFDLYIRKTEGEKCPVCYDDIRKEGANPDCKVCFGTGIKGGYEPMFQLYLRQKPAQTELALTSQGFVQNNNPGAWTISTVQIKNRDLLINPQGIIFQVTSSHINHAAGYLFHQELQMKELDPTDPVYKMVRSTLHPNL